MKVKMSDMKPVLFARAVKNANYFSKAKAGKAMTVQQSILKSAALAVISFLLPMIAGAADGFDLRLELGYVLSSPQNDDTFGTQDQYRITLGEKDTPVYLWGDHLDNYRLSMIGQNIGELSMGSAGVGFEYKISELSLFVEVGYADIDTEVYQSTLDEIPYSYLVGRHSAGDKTIPVDFCYEEGNCHNKENSFDSSAIVSRFGLSFELYRHISVMAAYKYAKVDQYIAIWDGNARDEGRGYWEEKLEYDLSAFEIGIIAKW